MELGDYASVGRWLGRLAPSTADVNLRIFRMWVNWVRVNGVKFADMDPNGLVEYQQGSENSGKYEILDSLVIPWIQSKDGTHTYLGKCMGTVRSFFLHNRAELPKDTSFRIRPSKPRVAGDLSIEEVRKVILSSNPLYQAVFTCMFMGGMDLASFEYWNRSGYDSLMEQLSEYKEGSVKSVKVGVPGRKASKNIKNFYTFIGRDAVDKILNYLPSRGEGDAIFLTKYGKGVTKNAVYLYWYRHVKKLGLISEDRESGERTGKNPHELRDVFRSRWRISGVDVEIAEFFMGHDIDKLGYDKSPEYYPEWFEDKYNDAQPWLNILSEDPQKVSRREVDTQRKRIMELEAVIESFQSHQNEDVELLKTQIKRLEKQFDILRKYIEKTQV